MTESQPSRNCGKWQKWYEKWSHFNICLAGHILWAQLRNFCQTSLNSHFEREFFCEKCLPKISVKSGLKPILRVTEYKFKNSKISLNYFSLKVHCLKTIFYTWFQKWNRLFKSIPFFQSVLRKFKFSLLYQLIFALAKISASLRLRKSCCLPSPSLWETKFFLALVPQKLSARAKISW